MDMSKDKNRALVLGFTVLFVAVIFIALMPTLWNALMQASRKNEPVIPRALPSDICMIDGKPLIPELEIIGYGNPNGLVLKYVNTAGDLVLLVDDKPHAVYEGDFCNNKFTFHPIE